MISFWKCKKLTKISLQLMLFWLWELTTSSIHQPYKIQTAQSPVCQFYKYGRLRMSSLTRELWERDMLISTIHYSSKRTQWCCWEVEKTFARNWETILRLITKDNDTLRDLYQIQRLKSHLKDLFLMKRFISRIIFFYLNLKWLWGR